MRVYLIGFMGVGKTSVGKQLASKLALKFHDLDQIIEQSEKKSIPTIFEEDGEAYFRKLEAELLRDFKEENILLSLGGGTPCHSENMEFLLKNGVVVYLTASPKLLRDRLIQSKTERPLLAPFKDYPEELLNFIEEKLAAREEFYNQANIKIEVTALNSDGLNELALKIQKLSSVS